MMRCTRATGPAAAPGPASSGLAVWTILFFLCRLFSGLVVACSPATWKQTEAEGVLIKQSGQLLHFEVEKAQV